MFVSVDIHPLVNNSSVRRVSRRHGNDEIHLLGNEPINLNSNSTLVTTELFVQYIKMAFPQLVYSRLCPLLYSSCMFDPYFELVALLNQNEKHCGN